MGSSYPRLWLLCLWTSSPSQLCWVLYGQVGLGLLGLRTCVRGFLAGNAGRIGRFVCFCPGSCAPIQSPVWEPEATRCLWLTFDMSLFLQESVSHLHSLTMRQPYHSHLLFLLSAHDRCCPGRTLDAATRLLWVWTQERVGCKPSSYWNGCGILAHLAIAFIYSKYFLRLSLYFFLCTEIGILLTILHQEPRKTHGHTQLTWKVALILWLWIAIIPSVHELEPLLAYGEPQ